MKKSKQIFSIPNILGYIRIILIPVFMYLYFTSETTMDYYVVTIIVGLSSLTDFFDGQIARRFNQITELGKFIDPLADKLTLAALIICFLSRYPLMWIAFGIYVVKELFMAFAGLIVLNIKGRKLDGAKWYGKVCTALMYFVMFFLMLFPMMDIRIVNTLIMICIVAMVITLVLYVPVFVKMWKTEDAQVNEERSEDVLPEHETV